MTAAPVRLSGRDLPAAAKINLALHVTGRRADGYHTLSSLVAFAEVGDRLSVAPAMADRFEVAGPFQGALASCPAADNIVLKALAVARHVAERAERGLGPVAVALDKRLPVASGIGGGSADAAALLRLVADALPDLEGEIRAAAVTLGADVPMCFDGAPAFVEGIGERAMALPRFPGIACVLINPLTAVSTPDVFRGLRERVNPPMPPMPPAGFATLDSLVGYLADTRNDLEAPATALVPPIADVTAALNGAGARFARMSGSGATVFGLFDSAGAAEAAAVAIAAACPGWWTVATRLKPASRLETPR